MAETSFGKYKLIAELGHGGMADVFLAVQAGPAGSGFRKLTVIKRLRQNLAEEPEFIAMLVDEARIAARLNHPNVVQTNEVGELNGQYFIAMEYLDGQPLHRIQHRNGQRTKNGEPAPFPKELQYVVVMDVLAGLHHAHELADYNGSPLEIVHRDMTPHNIFVTYEGQVKVVDFGIAKAAGRSSETRQGVIKGKVRYMAPEQAIMHNVDRRADLFALGVILWEVATGRRMWRDMDDLQIVQALVAGEIPRSPKAVNPEVPDGLDRICAKALAPNVDERYATAEEFRSELEEYLIESGLLSTSRRKLPAALAELFKDKREELRAIIERQLAELEARGGDSGNVMALPPSSMGSSLVSLPVSGSGSHSFEREPSGTNQSQVMSAPRSTSKVAAFGGVLLAAAVAAAAVGLGWRAQKPVQATTTTTADENENQVTIHVKGSPPGARVRIDDGISESLPLAMTVTRDSQEHKLRVEAEGYEAKTETVSFAQDVELTIDLVKSETPTVASAGATPTTPVVHGGKNGKTTGGTTHKAGGAAATTTTTTPTPANNGTAANTGTTTSPTHTGTTTTTTGQVANTAPPPPPPPTNTAPTVDVAAEHRKAVNRTVRQQQGDIQACYDRAKMTTPSLAGVVVVGATLAPNGSVTSSRIVSTTARSTQLESCLTDRFRAWTFPPAPPGASNDISYTFRFE